MELSIFPIGDENFWKAVTNVPDADVAAVAKYSDFPSEQIRILLVQNRYSNAICDHCHKKPPHKLYRCPECLIAIYCGDACMRASREKHTARCCRADGPLDDGPQQIVIIKHKE